MVKDLKQKLEEKAIELDQVTDDYSWSEIARKELTDEVEKVKKDGENARKEIKRVSSILLLLLIHFFSIIIRSYYLFFSCKWKIRS